VKPVAAELKL
jgi:hypothetical protein